MVIAIILICFCSQEKSSICDISTVGWVLPTSLKSVPFTSRLLTYLSKGRPDPIEWIQLLLGAGGSPLQEV